MANAAKAKPSTAQELLVSSGYSLSTATSVPGKIIEQPGVQEELNSLGFNEDNAKAVVAKILLSEKAENRDRLKASELVFKVHGSFQPDDTNEKRPQVFNIFNNPVFESATRTYEEALKAVIINNEPAQPLQEAQTSDSPEDGVDVA